ncbi:MAG: Flp pilus assembly protein CpaB, partial [Sphingomicrobium sp.]
MDVKKLALLVGALVIAVITAVMAKNMFVGAGAQQAAAAPAVPLGPKVMVAKKALPAGTIIDLEALSW